MSKSTKRKLSPEGLDQQPARLPQRPRYNQHEARPSESSELAGASSSASRSREPEILARIPFPDVKGSQTSVKQTPFQLPTQITSYSHDEEHRQRFDNSALRYYVGAPVGARLDYGYDRWIRKPDSRGRLDGLLNALQELKKNPSTAAGVPPDGLVCWRGIMTKCVSTSISRSYLTLSREDIDSTIRRTRWLGSEHYVRQRQAVFRGAPDRGATPGQVRISRVIICSVISGK